MARNNLLEFVRDYFGRDSEYLEYDNGFRRWTYSYSETTSAARVFCERLKEAGISRGDRVLLWSDSRPEWMFAFLGSLLAQAVVVPIGAEASAEFAGKVMQTVEPRAVAVGENIRLGESGSARVFHLMSENWKQSASDPGVLDITRNDLAEIVFTSGSTGEPKGVQITHGNLLSQIEAVEPSLIRIRKLLQPLQAVFPIRLLQLLPLSHMFGLASTLSLSPLVSASVIMTRQQSATAIARLIRQRRVSAAICVPRVFDMLRTFVLHAVPEAKTASGDQSMLIRRLWHYRRVHQLLGRRFLGFMLGGAALDSELERFWSGMGFLVVQGYGLTETSPAVSLGNPLHLRPGSAGRVLPGVQVRIAPDSEILVSGPNVTPGYYNDPAKTADSIKDGWFYTGDLGELDHEGHLYIRGRKKEMIATAEGLNVFPEDVERVLGRIPGVRESAVIGIPPVGNGSQEQVHAVLRIEPGFNPDQILAEANRELEAHQRIRDVSVWPEESLPRTAGTGKLKRAEIRDRIVTERASKARADAPKRFEEHCAPDLVTREIERRTGRKVTAETRLDELGLSSVDRVELLLEFEQHCQRTIEESEFSAAATIGDLNNVVERVLRSEQPAHALAPSEFPTWNRSWWARTVRRVNLSLWVLPVTRLLTRPAISGLEHLEGVEPPVIFAANHESNLDGPLILASLPARWRYRIAPAMYKEFFEPHFLPEKHSLIDRIRSSAEYYVVAQAGNAFPIPQREAGVRETLRYAGDLISDGWSLLIFPEGERRSTGQMGAFQSGVGLLAARLAVPVIPIYLENVDRVLPAGRVVPRPGPTRVAFGNAIFPNVEDPRVLTQEVEKAVKEIGGQHGTKR